MNEIPVQDRSYAPIEDNHLLRLAELAREEREYFFASWPRWQRLYADRRLCVALCQGAALHYVDGRNGVKDFDVWTFYTEHPERPFPPRRYYKRYYPFRDFGPSLFGRHPADVGWTGRKVDLLARSLACDIGADAVAVLQAHLSEGRNWAWHLAQKALVLLEPAHLAGEVIWDRGPTRRRR